MSFTECTDYTWRADTRTGESWWFSATDCSDPAEDGETTLSGDERAYDIEGSLFEHDWSSAWPPMVSVRVVTADGYREATTDEKELAWRACLGFADELISSAELRALVEVPFNERPDDAELKEETR